MPENLLEKVGARFLSPEKTKIFIGRLGSIHCIIGDTQAYANVYCLMCFPISYPQRYVSVCYTDDEGKEQEIGVIEDITTFSEDTRHLVLSSLRRQYFEKTVSRVYNVRFEFGLLFFEVETNNGREEFMMRWQYDKAPEYGLAGKVLLDVFENRFIIPSVEKLPAVDRDRLMRFIYW